MPRQTYYRNLFRSVAIWSWAVSLAYFIGDSLNDPFLHSAIPAAHPRVLLDMSVIPTFLFGFAFWAVSRDLNKNHAVVGVGVAGSILAFVSFFSRAVTGDISFVLVPASAIDLTFGLLMLEFMIWSKKHGAQEPPSTSSYAARSST
jgi:hypothetical protein